MNTIIKSSTLIFIVFILGLSSCVDRYINLRPASELTTANFFQSADDINKAVLGIYSIYQSRRPTDWIIFEMPTDELYPSDYHNFFGLEDLNSLSFSPDNPNFNNFWTSCYSGIHRANMVLSNIDKPDDYENEEQKKQYMGEAQFMRALLYFDLVRTFGGVPIVTGATTIQDSKSIKRSNEEDVYSLIIDDFKESAASLPTEMPHGRANKAAAIAFLIKVYVNLDDWKNAKKYLDIFMSDFNYNLVPDYKKLWSEDNEDNQESIFSIAYIDDVNGQQLSTDFLPYFGVEGLATHGHEDAFPTWSFISKFDNQDTRKDATVALYWLSPSSAPGESAKWYPYISKFAVPNMTYMRAGLDIPVIKYDNVLLLASEIEYNLNNHQKALSLLNEIRERAFHDKKHDYDLIDIPDKKSFYDILLLERQLELAYENERWFDLVRTDRLLNMKRIITYFNPNTNSNPLILHLDPQPYMKKFPIPQPQIDISGEGVIKQNDGY